MKLLNFLPKKNRFVSMGLALFASATLLSSCLKNDSDDGIDTPVAGISFVHAAASESAVGLYVDGTIVFNEAMKYGQSSQYLTAGVGNHLVETTIGGTSQKLSKATISLAEGKYYTVFVADRQGESDSLTTVMVSDAVDVAPATGKAKVRFVQLSPDAEGYELYMGDTKLFEAMTYKKSTEFREIDPAKLKFAVRLAGAAENKALTEDIDIKAGQFYTFVVGGSASATGTAALKVFPVIAR